MANVTRLAMSILQ